MLQATGASDSMLLSKICGIILNGFLRISPFGVATGLAVGSSVSEVLRAVNGPASPGRPRLPYVDERFLLGLRAQTFYII